VNCCVCIKVIPAARGDTKRLGAAAATVTVTLAGMPVPPIPEHVMVYAVLAVRVPVL
jgi:hypothetical protein